MGPFGIENETTEFKSAVNDSAIKTIVAFANGKGGTLYIGVDDDGEVIGVNDIDEELLKLSNKMRANIRPDILMMVSVEGEQIEGKNVVVITVLHGTKRPYYLASKGLRPEGVYVRSGAASVPTSDTAILQMIKETEGDSFETQISRSQDLTFEFAKKKFAAKSLSFGSGEMRTLGLIGRDGRYTNLALLLSDQCPSFTKAAAFDDDERNVFLEREEYAGSILLQLESAHGFMQRHNHFTTSYEGLERVDYYDYPPVSLRESVVNSIAHREFALSGPTLISVMPSRMEVVSLGGLPLGITFNDLSAHISMPRNRLFASVLFRLEIIEAYGTGMERMRSAYGNMSNGVTLAVTPNTFTVALANRNAKPSEGKMSVRNRTADETAVLEILAEGEMSRSEIQELAGFSQSTTIRILARLLDEGLVTKRGNGKNVRYCVR